MVPGWERWRARPRGHGRLDWVPGAALAMRRRAWDEVGPFDTRFRFYAQDLDFCTRAADAGWRVRLVEEAHVVHVGGATIGREPGATRSRSHPGLLWTDLLLWAEKTRGRAWASSAARCIALGARLRLLARAAVLPLLPSAEREEWRRDSGAFRQALDEVRRWQAARRPQGYEAGPGGTGGCGTGNGAGAPPG
jgi:GT2 family glycosyltransferase